MTAREQTDFPLPPDLPRPVDDGAAKHLVGMPLPEISLPSTEGKMVDLSKLTAPRTVLYFYPMTGVPGKPLPDGWDSIPGARGCTPQTCGFRDHLQELAELQTDVFGCSTQSTAYQREMADRLGLRFAILSDAEHKLCDTLRLPTFEVDGARLLKRLALIIETRQTEQGERVGRIEHVFYPVFPPNENAAEVVKWLRSHPIAQTIARPDSTR